MSCPQIYLGTGRVSPPLAADTANDAIVTPTDSLTTGVPLNVQVTVRNHGTDPTPPTDLELYWTASTTSIAPVNPIGTYPFAAAEILSAVSFPPSEGATTRNFNWTPSTLGHICLFARLKNTAAPAGACLQQEYGADPPTDPLSAIHCVQIVGTAGTGGTAGGTAGEAGAAGDGGGTVGEGGADTGGGATGEGGGVAGASDSSAGSPGGGSPHSSGASGGAVALGGGGASGMTGGGAGSAGTASQSTPPSGAGCGCRVSGADHLTTSVLFAGLGLFALFKRRRSRNALRRR